MKSFFRTLESAVLACFLAALASYSATAAIIGTNPPAKPLDAKRIATLPAAIQPAWKNYLERSTRQRQADQEFLKKELRENGMTQILVPPEGRSRRWLPLDRPDSWYRGDEARHVADVVLSFQTPAGGWSKNLYMGGSPRSPGMHFAPDNSSHFLTTNDFDAPLDAHWNYVGTFDNDATVQQLRFLAKVITAIGPEKSVSYRAAFGRGLDYIFAAQFPNGGWPQVWPLSGGYHDAITFNDGAMCGILKLLENVSQRTNEFSFVSEKNALAAGKNFQRGLDCLLDAQVTVDGRKTIWAQQYDMLTVKPEAARNYEMPSLAASESAGIMLFLMEIPEPDARIISAVNGAAAWFRKTEIHDMAFRNSDGDGRKLVSAPGAGPIWSRYYEVGTDRPLFGDRDKTIHDNVNEISRERRNGYSWYSGAPENALKKYARWSKANRGN